MLYGVHPICEALRAGRRNVQLIQCARGRRDEVVQTTRALAAERGVPVREVERKALERLCPEGRHQGLIAEVDPYPYAPLESLLSIADGETPLLLCLDQIQDPHNVGAIARTALGCGVAGILLPKDRSVGITPAVVQASAGAVEWLNIVQVTNIARTLNTLKDKGYWTVGLAGDGSASLYGYTFDRPHCLVLGSEGSGVRRLVAQSCDTLVSLPIDPRLDSYNVSVAAAMAMGEVMRQQIKVPPT
jgi:23S rRNA (guanosine2251-2'-O)-methyltransferase